MGACVVNEEDVLLLCFCKAQGRRRNLRFFEAEYKRKNLLNESARAFLKVKLRRFMRDVALKSIGE